MNTIDTETSKDPGVEYPEVFRVTVLGSIVDLLLGILKVGVGNLVDANLAKECANLTSLQIKQQLGVQAFSIANTGPQSILALFQ